MKKIIISILSVSTLFGMGGAVLANTLDVEKRAQVESNVVQMVDRCKELMGFSSGDNVGERRTCGMQESPANNGSPYNLDPQAQGQVPDPCMTEGNSNTNVID